MLQNIQKNVRTWSHPVFFFLVETMDLANTLTNVVNMLDIMYQEKKKKKKE